MFHDYIGIRKRYGLESKWKFIVSIETIKAIIKLILFQLSGGRMLLTSVIPERPPELTHKETKSHNMHAMGNTRQMLLGGKRIDEITTGEVTQYLMAKALVEVPKKSAIEFVGVVSGIILLLSLYYFEGERKVGEIFSILRAPIYGIIKIIRFNLVAYLLKQSSPFSWNPWLISLLIDLASRSASSNFFSKLFQLNASSNKLSALENEELQKRTMLFLYYLLRSPVYDSFTR